MAEHEIRTMRLLCLFCQRRLTCAGGMLGDPFWRVYCPQCEVTTLFPIDRYTTPTQVVVDGRYRFQRATGREVGADRWAPVSLHPATAAQTLALARRQQRHTLAGALAHASRAPMHHLTTAQCAHLLGMLAAYGLRQDPRSTGQAQEDHPHA